MWRFKKFLQNRWVIAVLLIALILLLLLPTYRDQDIEQYYSNYIYKGISYLLHALFSRIPFSVGDILYIAVILFVLLAIIIIVRGIFTKGYKTSLAYLFKLVIGTETAIIIFYLFWGLNYSRPPAAQLLNLQDTSYTINNVKNVTRMIIENTNIARSKITIADLTQSNQMIYGTAVKAVKGLSYYSPKYSVAMPAVKSSLLSPLLNYMGTSGYFNPFTGEAQINNLMPIFDRPFTACHEMAHQMGFGREDEANFVGYIAGVNSTDRLLNYSACYEATIEFLLYMHRRDTVAHHELKALLSKGVREDLKTDSLYWTKYEGQLGAMSSRFYDSFLKANQQPAGLHTYNRMIRLTMAWYKRQKAY